MLTKHLLLYFFARFIPALFTLATLSLYTRLMLPKEYGYYSLTVAVAVGLNSVLFQWVQLSMARFLPECETENSKQELFSTAIISLLLLGSLLLLINIIFPKDILPKTTIVLPLVAVLTCAQAWYDLCLKINNASLNPLGFGIMSVAKSALAFGLGWLMLSLGFGVVTVLSTLAFSLVISSVAQLPILLKIRIRKFRFSTLRKLFNYGGPLTLTFMMIFLIDVTGRFVLGYYHDAAAVGVFSVAYEFTQYSIGTLLAIVHLAGFPIIVKMLAQQGIAAAQQQLNKSFMLVLALALPSAIGIALLAPEISFVFFGSEYHDGVIKLMPWLALALLFSVLKSFYFDYSFQLAQSTFLQFGCVAIAAAVVVITCLLLIPTHGALGAAIASVAGFFSSMLLSAVLGAKAFPMPPLNINILVKAAMATVIMASVIWAIQIPSPLLSLLVKITVGGIVYITVLLALNYGGFNVFLKEVINARLR